MSFKNKQKTPLLEDTDNTLTNGKTSYSRIRGFTLKMSAVPKITYIEHQQNLDRVGEGEKLHQLI